MALRSHNNVERATKDGVFKAEIVAIELKQKKKVSNAWFPLLFLLLLPVSSCQSRAQKEEYIGTYAKSGHKRLPPCDSFVCNSWASKVLPPRYPEVVLGTPR